MNAPSREILGQHLILGFKQTHVNKTVRSFLNTYKPSGVILFAQNLDSPEQTAQLNRELCSQLSSNPFISIDEEGGPVDRLKKILPPLPSAESIANTGNPSLAYLQGDLIGCAFRLLGFNLNFAPVLDIGNSASKQILSKRTYGDNKNEVSKFAKSFIEGLKKHQILSCGKHFPGLGAAKEDTHFHLPLIVRSMVNLWQQDLVPYRRLLEHLPMVLVGHACYRAYDFHALIPASLSTNIIKGLLRKKLNYQGLIISDDLEMGSVNKSIPRREIGVRALKAGCDLLILSQQHGSIEEVMIGLEEAVSKGDLDLEQLEKSRARIATARRGLQSLPAIFNRRKFSSLIKKYENFSKRIQQ